MKKPKHPLVRDRSDLFSVLSKGRGYLLATLAALLISAYAVYFRNPTGNALFFGGFFGPVLLLA